MKIIIPTNIFVVVSRTDSSTQAYYELNSWE